MLLLEETWALTQTFQLSKLWSALVWRKLSPDLKFSCISAFFLKFLSWVSNVKRHDWKYDSEGKALYWTSSSKPTFILHNNFCLSLYLKHLKMMSRATTFLNILFVKPNLECWISSLNGIWISDLLHTSWRKFPHFVASLWFFFLKRMMMTLHTDTLSSAQF